MQYFSQEELELKLDFPSLVKALEKAFCDAYEVPKRHHHTYANPREDIASTLLLMPAWKAGAYLGIKLVTVSPNNGKYDLPSVQGIYTIFDAHKGFPLAQMDAKLLTAKRTAAASALASRFLSRPESKSLLMIGTGAVAKELIQAHACVRPIQKIYIWGRSFEKAKQLMAQLTDFTIEMIPVKTIEEVIAKVDIVSCATLSPEPLVFGKLLQAGQHIDLVGSYRPDMREADDELMRRVSLFVDDRTTAIHETGDLVIPIQKGIITLSTIKADLFDLCRKKKKGRVNQEEITCFKSVGHALEDLAAGILLLSK